MADNVWTRASYATVVVRFAMVAFNLGLLKNVSKLRDTQDDPVPTGITGAFRRLLQAYRAYKEAATRRTSERDE